MLTSLEPTPFPQPNMMSVLIHRNNPRKLTTVVTSASEGRGTGILWESWCSRGTLLLSVTCSSYKEGKVLIYYLCN